MANILDNLGGDYQPGQAVPYEQWPEEAQRRLTPELQQSLIDQIKRMRPDLFPPSPPPSLEGVPMSGMQPPVTLASMGQKYKSMPGELDRERPPQDIIRELYQQELLRQHIDRKRLPPETITPGSRSWPFGYTRI